MSAVVERIPDSTLADYWFSFKHSVLEALQEAFRSADIPQKEMAARIGKAPSFISRCLRGEQNMTLRTMSNIARSMDCRLDIFVTPLGDLRPTNRRLPPTSIESVNAITQGLRAIEPAGTVTANTATSVRLTVTGYD